MDGILQSVGVSQEAGRLLHIPLGNERADIGGADHAAVQFHRLDDIAADAALFTVDFELFGRALAPVAEAEIVAHHDPAQVQFLDNVVREALPGHTHGALVKVDKDHIVDPVAAADDLLPAQGAVDQGHLFAEHQRVRMNIEAQHRGHGADLGGALFGAFQQGAVADMYAVEKAQGDGPFDLCHVGFIPRKSF